MTENDAAPDSRLHKLMHHPWSLRIATVLWLCILAIAVWALHRQWKDLKFSEFLAALGRIGPKHICLALLFTTLSYLCNSSLDFWAMRHQRSHHVPWLVALRTSFVAMVFSINAGGALLTGGSVRIRTYSRFGMKPLQIGAIIIFISVVAWAGYCLNVGINLTLSKDALPNLPSWISASWAGPAFLAMSVSVVLLFMAVEAGKLTKWVPKKWLPKEEDRVRHRLSLIPVATLASASDYLFAGLTLRALFPEVHGIHLTTFLAMFALSQAAASISHVPAGAGVLEFLVTALLANTTDTASLASSLMAFRVIFYMLPFCLAAVILFSWEVWLKKQESVKASDPPAEPAEG